jgi:solute carrier family 12 (potassium/chloride transporter), member 4/6
MTSEETNHESKDSGENPPLDGIVELAETGHQHYHPESGEECHSSTMSVRTHHTTSVEEHVISPRKPDFHGMEFLDKKPTESRKSSRTMDSPRSILKDITLSLHHLYDKMPTVADRFHHNTIEEEGDDPDLIETKSQMLYGGSDLKKSHTGSSKTKVNTFKGVYVPTCEMMWGVIIFVRFGWITGQAGVGLALLAVILCAITATLTVSSLSAIATNGMVGGGTYHLLTKSLGPAWGGSISTIYYVGLTILSTVEIAGFSEIIVNLIVGSGKEFTGSDYWDNVVLSMLGLSLIFCLAMIGLTFLQNLAVIFMVALLLGYVSTFAGIFASPNSGSPLGVTGIRSATLRANLSPLFAARSSFADVMALAFPCFLGLMSGINQTAHLRNPYKSIPRGTFMAVCTSFGIYALLFIFLGSFAKRDLLISDKMLLINSGWPTKWIAIIGATLVGFGSSMQCLMVAPRMLQAIAKGKILTFLDRLGLETLWKGEPRKALIVSFMLAFPFLFIPELDTLAIIATMCFLQSYASANIVCFLMSVLQIPSWRPKYRYYHWTTALLGFMFCVSIMFIIHWIAALCSLFAFIILASYIQWAQEVKDWGEGIKGLQVHLALVGLLGAENEARKLQREREKNPDLVHPVSRIWRPHYLCFVGINDDHIVHPRLLSLLYQLKASRGLCIVAHVVEEFRQPDNGTNYDKVVEVVEQRRRVIQRAMADEDLDGFTNVISSLSQGEGMVTLLQGAGLSSLAPNTMFCAWPDEWKKDSTSSFRLINLLKWVRAHRKSAVFVKGVDSFPTSKEPQTGAIDVWWIVHEGGFLMLLAVLLRKSKTWKKCRLRIFTVAELTENSLAIENQIKNYLYYLRIKAEVHIVEMSTHQFAYFTNEWTVLREGRFGGPIEDKARFFPSFIDELHGVRHRTRAERITSICSIGPASLDLSPRNFNFTAGSTMTLQKAIVDHSQYSDLIIMNMPVPSQAHLQSSDEYMEMIDFLTLPLRRVLLVSGCGQEVIQVD